ncbi:hypothetical protein GQ42DRAFT_15525 [Ramicandelaber brevisporus]|nr:hypothetical protein GQ42DRAFT_15525 [Ramicandelaber brevisporus]
MQHRSLGTIKSKLHSIESKIRAAKDLIELNNSKIEAISNIKKVDSSKQATTSCSVQRADSKGSSYYKYSAQFNLLQDVNPPSFNF